MEKKENIFDILEELVAEVKSRQWDTEEDVWGAEAKLIDEYSEKIELKLSEAREEGGSRSLYTKGHKKWKATIRPATKDIGNMKPYTI